MVAVRERDAEYATHDLREHELTAAWLLGRVPAAVFAPWRLLRAGRAGRGPGPDVREAAFALPGGTVLAGDVEVHLRASDFMGHGHRHDAAYAGVVLHLVWEDDRGSEAAGGGQALPGGRIARTVAVGSYLGGRAERLRALVRLGPSGAEPCAGDDGAVADVRLDVLRREGERRLAERAWRAGELAARLGWDDAWTALLDRALAASAGRRAESAEERAALAAVIGRALGPEPVRALASFAHTGTAGRLIGVLRAHVLGAGRAAEVGWNAALPLLAALAAAYGEPGLARDVAALVAAWPAPRPYGRTLALASTLAVRPRRAVEAQGLLHVQELWCGRGGCGGRCPFTPSDTEQRSVGVAGRA